MTQSDECEGDDVSIMQTIERQRLYMRKIYAAVFISIVIAVSIGAYNYCKPLTLYDTKLIGYSQNEKSLTVEFEGMVTPVKYSRLSDMPESLDLQALKKGAVLATVTGNRLTVPLENEPTSGEYSILIFLGDSYLELVRQSEKWLEQNYDYKRVGGYTILGRRSISTAKGSISWPGPLAMIGRPHSIDIDPVNISQFNEINLATGLLHAQLVQPIYIGPTTRSYSEFLQQPYEEKLRRIQTGEFAVMCTGFRDLFVHASIAIPGLKIRLVDAVNYQPQIHDLITYGHSTAEVWVEQLSRWVLFDPWLGIIVTHNGVPIGADELSKAKNTQEISVVPVIDQINRMYRQKNGKVVFNSFYPQCIEISKFSCDKLGCMPGYVEYFKNFKVREVIIK